MTGQVQVGRFRPEKWEVLRELRLRALAEDSGAFGSTHGREREFGDDIWRERATAMALATCGGTPAGIVGARAVEHGALELISMWVAPEFRGRGVGDALVKWVVDEARRERRLAVKLWFATGNDAARRLYERAGFVEVDDDTPLDERFDRHDHRMVLPLRNARTPVAPSDEAIIPVLRVAEATRAVAWYARLGFVKQWEHQFEPGFPWFVCIARGSVRIYLSEHEGDARPDTLVHLNVANIDEIASEFGETVDEDGLAGREVDLADPDGNRLRIATPRS